MLRNDFLAILCPRLDECTIVSDTCLLALSNALSTVCFGDMRLEE